MLIGPSTSTLVLCNLAGPNHVDFMLISKHRHLRRKGCAQWSQHMAASTELARTVFKCVISTPTPCKMGWYRIGINLFWCVLTVTCLCFGQNELNLPKRWQCSGRLRVQPRDEAALQLSVGGEAGGEATWASSASVTQFVPAVIHYVLLWGRLAAFAPTPTPETGQKGLWRNKGKKIPARVEGIAWWDQWKFEWWSPLGTLVAPHIYDAEQWHASRS